MQYSIPDCFMISLLLGLAFGLVYEALRIVRLILRHKAVTFLCDIVFFILAAMAVFRISLVMGNHIRLYTLLGFGAGVFAYIATVGRLMNVMESAAAVCWRRTLGRLLRFIGRKLRDSVGAFAHILGSHLGKINNFLLSNAKKALSPLKMTGKKMYNKEDNNIMAEGSGNKHVIRATVKRG